MKYVASIFIFLFSTNASFGQMFSGKQTDKSKRYNCHIRINKDNTVNFIYDRDHNGVYGEYAGTIDKRNDTLYRVSAVMTMGQFYMKSFDDDNIYIQIDPKIATHLDKIQVEYANKKNRKQFQGYDASGKPINLIKIPVDKKLFNARKGSDFITITVNRKNFLTDKPLSCRISFGSAASFTSGQKIEFDIVVKGDQLWTVGEPPLQTGHFKLRKKSGT